MSGMEEFLAALNAGGSSGGDQVYTGVKVTVPGSTNRPQAIVPPKTSLTISLKDWNDRWFKLPAAERAKYTQQFISAGINGVTNEYNAYGAWEALGKESAGYHAAGGNITPLDLLKFKTPGGTTAAMTAKEKEVVIQSAAQGELRRNISGDEYTKALSTVNKQDKNTGSAGVQLAVQQQLRGTQEYQAKTQNDYLGYIYDELAKEMQRVKKYG